VKYGCTCYTGWTCPGTGSRSCRSRISTIHFLAGWRKRQPEPGFCFVRFAGLVLHLLVVEVCMGTDTETHPHPSPSLPNPSRPSPSSLNPYLSYATLSRPVHVRCVAKNSPSPLYPHNATSRKLKKHIKSTQYRNIHYLMCHNPNAI